MAREMHSFSSSLTSHLLLVFACASLLIHDSSNFASASPVDILASSGLKTRKIPGGYSVPLKRTKGGLGRRNDSRKSKRTKEMRKRVGVISETGLGDFLDLIYTVPVEIGGIVTAVQLDSDACTATSCNGPATAEQYPMSTFNDSGASVTLAYGGGTASGPIGFDTVTVAGIAIQNQAFAAVDATDIASVTQQNAAGILGVSFPTLSKVQQALTGKSTLTGSDDSILGTIAMTGALDMPMFSIQLQRATIDIGQGVLTIGALPEGINNGSLTWVPVRLYKDSDRGTTASSFTPVDEAYPFRWEIDIDGVFLDGQRVRDSAIPANGVSVTTTTVLIDSGTTNLEGPSDVVNDILSTVSTTYDPSSADASITLPCDVPHTLAFQIGGKVKVGLHTVQ
ncbi:hypothetical protein D9758_015789 [Tetrapyrgos nigripes]|uniref:Peptidase A1 domain-containing protein n=1 Tax=Tetrapyrgos nigripes TaxID=182062 RepID=A0A8H5C4W0_9AGAR|nr:hypothetical protein D9758_015789 [Tetrapyrgos nigripes]